MRHSALRQLDTTQLVGLLRHLRQGTLGHIWIPSARDSKLFFLFEQGVSIRTVECRHLVNNSAAPDELCSGEKPPTERSCSAPLAVCGGSPISHSVSVEHNHTSKVLPQWRTGSWGSVMNQLRTLPSTSSSGFVRFPTNPLINSSA